MLTFHQIIKITYHLSNNPEFLAKATKESDLKAVMEFIYANNLFTSGSNFLSWITLNEVLLHHKVAILFQIVLSLILMWFIEMLTAVADNFLNLRVVVEKPVPFSTKCKNTGGESTLVRLAEDNTLAKFQESLFWLCGKKRFASLALMYVTLPLEGKLKVLFQLERKDFARSEIAYSKALAGLAVNYIAVHYKWISFKSIVFVIIYWSAPHTK
ncbi:hypothetical protein EGR_10636 [Echinococcus granulosus]|uniref:Uncharacterized protein n=1 Tax=Echinococcus granulosus TaxID=6210 RepID=W6U082_ECHGR|nr:hypothetical protein EGR_10636 [Echinococcus granulosus]EUB54500.1 hypothetical protein EGR_10636 [Echinococcus granulosus]